MITHMYATRPCRRYLHTLTGEPNGNPIHTEHQKRLTTMTQIQIRLPTPTEQNSLPFITHIVHLVNEAYASTESNIYKPGKLRTNATEVQSWLETKTLYLAFTPDSALPIGTVRTYKIDATVSDVGILTVHHDARALGLGRRLVAHAEMVAMRGGARTARLEMLVPNLSGLGKTTAV